MILTLDIGNTNIKTALFSGTEMVQYWRLKTDIAATSDELGLKLTSLLLYHDLKPDAVEGIILSSVVPSINFTIEHMCKTYFRQDPMLVVPGIRTD